MLAESLEGGPTTGSDFAACFERWFYPSIWKDLLLDDSAFIPNFCSTRGSINKFGGDCEKIHVVNNNVSSPVIAITSIIRGGWFSDAPDNSAAAGAGRSGCAPQVFPRADRLPRISRAVPSESSP